MVARASREDLMITSTAIIAGMCVGSICLASLVARAADSISTQRNAAPAGASLPSVTDLVIDPYNGRGTPGPDDLAAGSSTKPAKGHYLFTGSAYSLGQYYGDPNAAAGDLAAG